MLKHPRGHLYEPSPTNPSRERGCDSCMHYGRLAFFEGDYDEAIESGRFITCENPIPIGIE